MFALDRDLRADINSSAAAKGLRPMLCPDSNVITFLQLDMQAANSKGVMTSSKEKTTRTKNTKFQDNPWNIKTLTPSG